MLRNLLKSERVKLELEGEILSGKYGVPGSLFITTRDLVAKKDVSLRTAHQIIGALRDDAFLELKGKRNYLRKPLPATSASGRLLIGLLVSCLENPFFSMLARELEQHCRELGAELIIAASNYSAQCEKEKLEMFYRQGVSGIVACPWAILENREYYLNLPVPFVLIGRKLEHAKADTVLVNSQLATQQVAEHFVECSYRNFGYIGPEDIQQDSRLQGFRAGLHNFGYSLPEENILQFSNVNSNDDLAQLSNLIKRHKDKTAIFCFHDLFAVRALNICHRLRVNIPEQVALAGFDNLPIASQTYPAITSVGYPVRDMACIALEILQAKLKSPTKNEGIVRYLESKLIVRQSTDLMAGTGRTIPKYMEYQTVLNGV